MLERGSDAQVGEQWQWKNRKKKLHIAPRDAVNDEQVYQNKLRRNEHRKRGRVLTREEKVINRHGLG